MDEAKLLAHIATVTTIKDLENLMVNARKQGRPDIERAAFRRLCAIQASDEPGSVAHDLWQAIHALELALKQERGKTVRLSRTRQKVAKVGAHATLCDWALGSETEGFSMLIERGMPELTGEAIIMAHASEFPIDVVAAARARMDAVGYVAPATS